MARYALRNQQKITATFGKSYTDLLLESLDYYFANAKHIEVHDYEGEKYRVIRTEKFEFYVIEKKYDVYKLAYKSAAG